MAPLLEVSGLRVSFPRDSGMLPVLRGVTLALEPGQSLGIVGESGAGKTVLVRAILGLLDPPWQIERGTIRFAGEELLGRSEDELRHIRGNKIGLTSPEARKHLNPLLRVGEQIANVVQAHERVSRRAAWDRARELLADVGIPDPAERVLAYPHELSGGMCQRVVIAMALAHRPRLLLADEPTAGLDVTISRQILDLMRQLVRDSGSSLVVVSRDLGVVAHYCERVAVMYAGEVVESGDVAAFFVRSAHPYSRHLLKAAQAARDQRVQGGGLGRRAPLPPGGCSYAPRCPIALPVCSVERPELKALGERLAASCHRRQEVMRDEVSV